MRTILFAVLGTMLAACADTSMVRDASPGTGIEQRFAGTYDAVSAATLDSIRSLNVNISSTEDRPEGLAILVAKPLSAFSWGEVWRVMVVRVDGPNTPVRVYWEKRARMQITGTGQEEFAGQLFHGIAMNLARTQK